MSKLYRLETERTSSRLDFYLSSSKLRGKHLFVVATIAFSIRNKLFEPLGPQEDECGIVRVQGRQTPKVFEEEKRKEEERQKIFCGFHNLSQSNIHGVIMPSSIQQFTLMPKRCITYAQDTLSRSLIFLNDNHAFISTFFNDEQAMVCAL